MREIKFRAWDNIGNCWVQDHLLQDFVSVGVPEGEKDNGVLNLVGISPRVKLMQFTGLLDKNGKEIYEGDILKEPQYGVGVIEWFGSGFMLCYTKDGQYLKRDFLHHINSVNKVIGNIMENPDLLK